MAGVWPFNFIKNSNFTLIFEPMVRYIALLKNHRNTGDYGAAKDSKLAENGQIIVNISIFTLINIILACQDTRTEQAFWTAVRNISGVFPILTPIVLLSTGEK